jgi:hypothetical protein
MAFRAEEAAQAGFERAVQYLIPNGADSNLRLKVKSKLLDIVEECGPVVEGYPGWHPFLVESDSANWSPMTPNDLPSFRGLDHTIYFQNGILTCPYGEKTVKSLIEKVGGLTHRDAYFTFEEITDVTLYHENAVPLLIKCKWLVEWKEFDNTFTMRTALGLMLEREIPNWRRAAYCENWEDMRGSVMGYPHGARSSLFVNQITGQQIKNFWNQIFKSGLLGDSRD